MTVWRPIDRADGKQPWFALDEAQFCSEYQLIRLEPLEDGDLGPFQGADLQLGSRCVRFEFER